MPDSAGAWSRARELFLELADLPASDRADALAEIETADVHMAAWVRRLLEQDLGTDGRDDARSSKQLFGPYETVRRIAAGGMGEVFLARRSDGEFEREVAIKRLRLGAFGEELVERFLRERQTLARLDHEFIARLLDGGTSESGEPYLVLEYVVGRHIDTYCREEALTVSARVELFMEVLEAVAHAHQRGVVHRDLKPSNILIRGDGAPRLLDFGIARSAVQGEPTPTLTSTGQRLFTPGFASPEQVRGERASEASDIFSLGIILYTLLAGSGPWEGADSMHELELCTLERDPVPPSRHLEGRERRQVLGDLDTIVLHCLQKRVAWRYASVEELRQELGRSLAGLPIRTRPTRVLERVLRYGRRNPWQALAGLVLVIAFVTSGLALHAGRAAASRRAQLMPTLLGRLEHARGLRLMDDNQSAVAELRAVLATLEALDGEDSLRAEVLSELTDLLLRVGEPRESLALVDQGLALLPGDPEESAETRARLLLSAVECHRLLSTPEEAREAVDRAHRHAIEWLEAGDPLRLGAIEALGTERSIPLDERIALLAGGVAEGRDRDQPHDGALASLLSLIGFLRVEKGEFEAALESIDEALAIDRWNHGEGHGDVAMDRFCRGVCLERLGRSDEAVVELEAALGVFEDNGHEDMAVQARQFLDGMLAAEAQVRESL